MANFFTRIFGTSSQQLGGLPYFGPELRNAQSVLGKNPQMLAGIRRSVSVLSDAVASTEITLVQKVPSGGRKRITGTPISEALAAIRFTSWETAIQDSLYTGNGFMSVEQTNDGIVIQSVPCHRVSVALSKSGEIFYQVAADENVNEPERVLSSKQMIHIKYRCDSASPHVGVSPLAQISGSLAAIVETYHLQAAIARNVSSVGLMLVTESNLTKESSIRLKEICDSQTQAHAAGSTLILSSGLKPVTANTMSLKDADLVESMKFSISEIGRVFGIPSSLLNQSEESSYSKASEERRAFIQNTLKPLFMRIQDAMAHALLTREDINAGYQVEFDLTDISQEQSEVLSSLVNHGLVTINEARSKLNLVDIEGGDVARSPANTLPISDWLQYYKQPEAPEPSIG